MVGNDRKAFFRNSFMLYLMQFATYVFPLMTFPYLTRVLGPEKYGVMAYVMATCSFFHLFVDFGFMLSATKAIVENRNDKEKLGRIVGTVLLAKLFFAIISIIFLTIMIVFIPVLRANMLYTYLSFVVIILSIFLPDFLFRGLERMSILTLRFVISKTITTVLVFVLVKSDSDLLFIPVLSILGSLIAVILTWVNIWQRLKIKVVFSSLRGCFEATKLSFDYFIAQFASTVFGATNTFMIGIFAPPTQIAFWGTAYNLISTAQGLYSPIIDSLYPHMVAKKDYRFVKQILLILMPIIFIITSGVFIYAEPIIILICGEKYLEAIPVFRALTPVLILSFPVLLLGFPVLGAMGKVKETSLSIVYSALFHFGGLVFLILVTSLTY